MNNTNQTMREQYKELYKQLLQRKKGDMEPDVAELCAEVAWQTMAYHTSHMLDLCEQTQPPQRSGLMVMDKLSR